MRSHKSILAMVAMAANAWAGWGSIMGDSKTSNKPAPQVGLSLEERDRRDAERKARRAEILAENERRKVERARRKRERREARKNSTIVEE